MPSSRQRKPRKKTPYRSPQEPPILTPEECERLLQEGLELRKALEERLNRMTRLTAEDWHFRCK